MIFLNLQTAKRRKDAKQNYPAEFVLYSDINDALDRDYDVFCEGCDDSLSTSTSNKYQKHSVYKGNESKNEDIIEFSSGKKKVNDATDDAFMNEVTRSVASQN